MSRRKIKLPQAAISKIEEILESNRGTRAEVAVFKDRLVVFENKSTKAVELDIRSSDDF